MTEADLKYAQRLKMNLERLENEAARLDKFYDFSDFDSAGSDVDDIYSDDPYYFVDMLLDIPKEN